MLAPIKTLPAQADLERRLSSFEEAWQREGGATIAAFLPEPKHPRFGEILCELVRIDLELHWTRGRSRRLDEYRLDYPELFADPSHFQKIAFEEYRQRLQAGETASPSEYEQRYRLDVSSWPETPGRESADLCRTQRLTAPPNVTRFPQAPEEREELLEQLKRSVPGLAERFAEAEARMPHVGERFLGFTLVKSLGRGSFGQVFLAQQSDLADRFVALKVSSDLRGESQKLARLQHTNIMPIHSVHEVGALQAICMPYLGATSLAQVVEGLSRSPGTFPQSGRGLLSTLFNQRPSTVKIDGERTGPAAAADSELPAATPILDHLEHLSHVDAVLWIGARLADGLAHAHERGILHRDLKPANILLSDDGQPMLLDFNLSIDLKNAGSAERACLGGTLPYMAPEHLDALRGGTLPVDERSDLYGLGVILFEMLTGAPPFALRRGKMDSVIPIMLSDRRNGAPSPRYRNPAITPAVDAIVRKLLDPDPARRYQKAADVREDIERHLANQPLKYAPNRSVSERWRKWRRRHPRLATACLVGLVAGLVLVLPASVIAVRQSQIAERKMQTETAEAKQTAQELGQEARTVQALLATRTGDRALLNRGLERGQAVLERYGIGRAPDWMRQPLVSQLSSDQQMRLRYQLGELLLFMARGEQIRAGDASQHEEGLRIALRWNVLAEECYPPGQLPRLLARQREELLKLLPEEAARVPLPIIDPVAAAQSDPYHEGVACAMDGRYREALISLRPFTEEHPRHFQSWFVRGLCHDLLGQFADAAACDSVCISLEPEMPWAWFNRGLVRLHQADFPGAERDCSQALRLQANWPIARLNRAIARKGNRDFAGAISDLDELLAQEEAPVRAWFLRAEVKELAGDPDGASRDRAEGMKLVPRDELSWSTRGYALMKHEPAAALKDFDEALALNPRSREALLNKSIVLSEALNRPRDAVAALDRLLEYYPDHLLARAGRGVVLARLGECARARKDAEDCLRQERTPFLLFQMAGLYAQLSRHEESLDARQEALRLLGNALRNGFINVNLLKNDADLDPIRDDLEFQRLAEAADRLNEPKPQ